MHRDGWTFEFRRFFSELTLPLSIVLVESEVLLAELKKFRRTKKADFISPAETTVGGRQLGSAANKVDHPI